MEKEIDLKLELTGSWKWIIGLEGKQRIVVNPYISGVASIY